MGTLTAVGLLPHLLFSLLAGVWLDRVRERRRLMIAADLGRAALIASIPVAFALDALAMPQLYVVGFLSGTLSVIFDLSWNTLFVAVTKRDRYVEAHGAAQWQPVARLGRRADRRRPPGPGPRRAAGDARRRDLVPGIGRLPAPDPGARTADRARGRLDPRAAAGRTVVRDPRPDHAPDAALGGDGQHVHVRLERAVHPVRDDDPRRLPGRARAGARDRVGRCRHRGDLRVAHRSPDRARAGLRARPADLPDLAAADPAGRCRTCRWR